MSNLLKSIVSPCLLLIAICLLPSIAAAQSDATLSGTVVDQNGGAVPGAKVTITNLATGVERSIVTNDSGSFTAPLLNPSNYRLLVEANNFKRVQLPDIVLNVGDRKALRVELEIGDIASSVDVRPDADLVDTDGGVGTVVNQEFVSKIPLNGRSFQSLLELTPGVVLVPSGGGQSAGQFSVNGQRASSNYFTIDGVGANAGISANSGGQTGQAGSGQLPAFTASGTTAGMVSVDALQEFKIQTSSYAPEFGRQPGGQISLVTKSGGNDFHGSAYDYVRNEFFDANDWFANRNRLKKPPTRQHQFGGTFSGPVYFPNFGDGGPQWYSGRDRTFFFFSYEGLRLQSPKTIERDVPSLCLRGLTCTVAQGAAQPQFWPYLRALPFPNASPIKFAASYADPSTYDATAIRLDHTAGRLTFFGRFSHTPSDSSVRNTVSPSSFASTNQNNSAITAGSTWRITESTVLNDVRLNYTTTSAPIDAIFDGFGGGEPLSTFGFRGNSPENSQFNLVVTGPPTYSVQVGRPIPPATQRQFNIVDNLLVIAGDHQFKFGFDYRRLNPTFQSGEGGFESVSVTNAGLASGHMLAYVVNEWDNQPHSAAFENYSAYAQDTWKVSNRFTLTYGVRWEFVPPPHATEGGEAVTLEGLDDPLAPGHLSIAPIGTPLWEKRHFNFAPRVGASYLLLDGAGRQLVVRGGGGLFYDLGLGNSAEGYALQWPYFKTIVFSGANPSCPPPYSFPPPACTLLPLTLGTPVILNILDRNISLPLTYQWNFSAEQSLGNSQAVTVSYVGAAGRKLLARSPLNVRISGFTYTGTSTTSLNLQRNLGYSDYEALQLQFQRRLTNGFQALVNYTFSKSQDTQSADDGNLGGSGLPIEAAPADLNYSFSAFDVRHNLTAAATYDIPGIKGNAFLNALTRNWGVNFMFRMRSGFPFNPTVSIPIPPLPGNSAVRPNVIPGLPIWIDDPSAPGGRRLNNATYTFNDNPMLLAAGCRRVARNPQTDPVGTPTGAARGAFCTPEIAGHGNLARNTIRGFGAKQLDISITREFGLSEKVRMKLNADVFNVFNWPNFANPITSLNASNFGEADQMLNRGLGGLSALYQIGGPRSMQFAARISF